MIHEICKDRFHSLLRIAYEAVKPNPLMTGRILGADPVVNVVMDFETHMLGRVFKVSKDSKVCNDLMPDSVYFKYYPEE